MTQTTVQKRDGAVVPFDAGKLTSAITAATVEVYPSANGEYRGDISRCVDRLTEDIADRVSPVPVEDIQDMVERTLNDEMPYEVCRAYIVYREQHKAARERRRLPDWLREALDLFREERVRGRSSHPADDEAEMELLSEELKGHLGTDMATPAQLEESALVLIRTKIESDPTYSYLAAQLKMLGVYRETGANLGIAGLGPLHEWTGEELRRWASRPDYDFAFEPDFDRLASALDQSRDRDLRFLGVETLADRYLDRAADGTWAETPQLLFLRVALGLAETTEEAEGFYETVSTLRYMPATPTLFNAGMKFPQLSSCFLTTADDDLKSIFAGISENAMLSKWAGGLGNDWSRIRASGARIAGTKGKSQGVIPFLKIVNDTAVAVNQGGKRKGAVCSYLAAWHKDLPGFLQLHKNVGEERRRTPDMHTAIWIPDLFMDRATKREPWTLFSPEEVPELNETWGERFNVAYLEAERRAREGEIENYSVVDAEDIWREILNSLYETGHPWITFKDACNNRNPQSHCGIVRSSNLCTEITLNTSDEETAVCNLGSVNLAAHAFWDRVDERYVLHVSALRRTVETAVRMLDNVIDRSYYGHSEKAERSNLAHRALGLGVMGWQDLLYEVGIDRDGSPEHLEFTSYVFAQFGLSAIVASAKLARERGRYSTYEGSTWSRGLLPQDTYREHMDYLCFNYTLARYGSPSDGRDRVPDGCEQLEREARLWVETHGMRNCNVTAIAPTATIANIVGVTPSIEPMERNLFVRSNLSGNFTAVNEHLVEDLREAGLWDADLLTRLKIDEGSVRNLPVGEEAKAKYRTAFEIDPEVFIAEAAVRQVWLDQSQSLNLYLDEPDGRKLSEMYVSAWRQGLKTTYYLRNNVETTVAEHRDPEPAACSILDEDCEACQ